MKCLPDQDDPFSFEGPEIFKCVGCAIDWLPGKNLTVKQVPGHQLPFDFRCMMNYSKRSDSLSLTHTVRFARDQLKDLPELPKSQNEVLKKPQLLTSIYKVKKKQKHKSKGSVRTVTKQVAFQEISREINSQ